MGWTFTHKEDGVSLLDFFKKEFSSEGVIDVAQVGWNTAYMAVKMKEEKICGFVILISRKNDYFNFGYKEIDEGMGPYECNCPARILNRLSPPEEIYQGNSLEWSREWRRKCRVNLEKKKTRIKLSPGAKYSVQKGITFSNGVMLYPGDQIMCLDPKRRVFSPVKSPSYRLKFSVGAIEDLKAGI